MKKRIMAIIALIAYIIFIVWFTIKDLPKLNEKFKNNAEKNSVEASENGVLD